MGEAVVNGNRGRERLAFMTIGALFGVKIFRRNPEHIVTLDAHPMEHRLPRRRRLVFWGMSLLLGRLCSHVQILAQLFASQQILVCLRRWHGGIPARAWRILWAAVGAVKPSPVARSVSDTLLECRFLTSPV